MAAPVFLRDDLTGQIVLDQFGQPVVIGGIPAPMPVYSGYLPPPPMSVALANPVVPPVVAPLATRSMLYPRVSSYYPGDLCLGCCAGAGCWFCWDDCCDDCSYGCDRCCYYW